MLFIAMVASFMTLIRQGYLILGWLGYTVIDKLNLAQSD